ncbi:uncharacterized protein LOC8058002 [Sorghum bicolor]|uniref:uncharacterized protein LOC8058002 n=1 Tax=Sorghum bicolor TaxID=4558 RepID=UPI000B426776|nr:uncharacterized protein LOC8058002 [Sorghum bicolor]|eukprot:XP_021321392.1 uncharacterized protein LOC8058002 [Sorghum bicolor]
MASTGDGGSGDGSKTPKPNVTELFRNLKLTEDEVAILEFSDDEDSDTMAPTEWTLVGKVLSPAPVHVTTVRSAMRPAWGNPIGLKFRAIGEKEDNLFVVEFGSARDKERVLGGSPWMVGKYSVLLQEYDEKLCAADIKFDRLDLWVRILNLPLGWMNRSRGSRAMGLIGQVVEMDVDADGKASGAFLRARVSMEIDKPVRRGILLRVNKTDEPRWFQAQYEKLPYMCFACGIIGHSDMECPTPVARDEDGKLPYDVNLRAPEEKKRRLQSFAAAAAESFGSGSSSGLRRSDSTGRTGGKAPLSGDSTRRSASQVGNSEEPEVQSPMKQQQKGKEQGDMAAVSKVSRQLDIQVLEEDFRQVPRKRKSKPLPKNAQTPDPNVALGSSSALVPAGVVNSRVNLFDATVDSSGNSLIEILKKQKRGNNQNAGSAAAVDDSPRRAQ